MEKVRFGIVGVGNMGTGHSKNFLGGNIENGVLTAICDLKKEKMEKIKALDFPGAKDLKTFTDYHEMFASGLIDAVIVAVPHYFHPQIAMDAMDAGLHVVCEKPAGVYTKQVKEMNAYAKQHKTLFTMMFNQRTNCVYRKMREMVQNGELGDIRRVTWIITDWYRAQSYYDSGDWRATWKGEGGGVLFNQCPHQLDLLQWVVGMMPKTVNTFAGYGKWHNIEVEDDVTTYLTYENGATGIFITTTAECPGTNRFEISGDKGKLTCERIKTAEKDEFQLTFYRLSQPEREFNATYKGGFGQPDCEVIAVETDGKNPQHKGILNNFANAVLGIEPLFVDGAEGLNGVEIMDAMQMSGWQGGKTVTLPIDDDKYYEMLQEKISSSTLKKEVKEAVLNTDKTY